MKILPAVLALSVSIAVTAGADALPRSAPEVQGIASSAILDFIHAAEESIDALHSVMLLRHGHVVAEGWWEPYRRDDPHEMYSLSKSFTATAVGLAIAEGRFGLDDSVLSHFPEAAPEEPGDNLKAMRVRDLLRMNTGHHADELQKFQFFGGDVPLTRAFLALSVAHKPGTHFLYNTPATYMLSALVQKTTGQTVLDYLRPRLFEPLGIEDPPWPASPDGVTLGGFGLSLRTEDVARFGQLYLQKGAWRGEQLVASSWVEEATALQTSNGSSPDSDWDQGYGYQFWRTRHGLYRGDGAFGQYCIVMEAHDAVVAITGAVRDMGAVMNLVWEHVLPALGNAPLPPDPDAAQRLATKLAALSLPPQAGNATSPLAAQVSGRRYALPDNRDGIQSIGLDSADGASSLVLGLHGKEWPVPLGYGTWTRGEGLPGDASAGSPDGLRPSAGTGAWIAEDTFAGRLCLYETVYCTRFALRFEGDVVLFDQEHNVAFGDPTRPRLVGELNR